VVVVDAWANWAEITCSGTPVSLRSTATTDEYLRRLSPTQLVDVMTARRWQDVL
jgi:hypothetical protein